MRGLQVRAGAALTTPAGSRSPDGRPERAAQVWLVGVTVLAYAADQLSKQWALSALDDGARHPVLGDLLGFRLIFNPGAALSFGAGSTWIFTIVAVVVVIAVIRLARRLTSRVWATTLGLLLAGALGNLTDRLVRPPGFGRGHVVDFIDYGVFIGNVADIWIVGAAFAMIALSIRGVPIGPAEPVVDQPGTVTRESASEAGASESVSPEAGASEGESSKPAAPGFRSPRPADSDSSRSDSSGARDQGEESAPGARESGSVERESGTEGDQP